MKTCEEAESWQIVNCSLCGRPFGQEAAYQQQCLLCFKKTRNYALLGGDLAFAAVQNELHKVRTTPVEPPTPPAPAEPKKNPDRSQEEVEKLKKKCREYARRLKKMEEAAATTARVRAGAGTKARPVSEDTLMKIIRLCHPDRHGNSELAKEVTQWALEQRSRS